LDSSTNELIKRELLSWKGVSAHEHSFASTIFYVNGLEIGHLHGDAIADLQFPKKIGKKLVADGRVLRHHVIPKSEWVSYEIRNAEDVHAVIELFRLQYQRLANLKLQK